MSVDWKGARLTWLGHSAFRLETGGKTLLMDPWIMGNPACPASEKQVKKVDALLCTHGHYDHIGDALTIAKQHNPLIVGIFELATWLQKKGARQVSPMNKGGTQEVFGNRVTMVHAVHSCGIEEDDGSLVYGGEAAGYVVELENGLKIYHAGDTGAFRDMEIIRELYAPDVALLPIGDHFVMSPREAAYACKMLRPKCVIPMHFGTFPVLTGTPAELKQRLKEFQVDAEVLEMKPGQTIG